MAITYIFNEDTDLEIINSEYPHEKHIIYRKDRTDDQLKDWGRLTLATHFAQQNKIENTNSMRDDVYMNGELGRSDYTIGLPEGEDIVSKLNDKWRTISNIIDFKANPLNIISEYEPLREPYVNSSISFYCFDPMPHYFREKFNVSNDPQYVREWWGLKFDKTTKEILCKMVYSWTGFQKFRRDDFIVPDFPFWIWDKHTGRAVNGASDTANVYVAMIHDENGNINDHYDIYFQAPQNLVKEWCDENDIPFGVLDDINNIMQYGITINGTTGEIKYVKTYKRFFI